MWGGGYTDKNSRGGPPIFELFYTMHFKSGSMDVRKLPVSWGRWWFNLGTSVSSTFNNELVTV